MSKKKKVKRTKFNRDESVLSGLQIPDLIQVTPFDASLENLDDIKNKIESGANNDLGRAIRVMFISEASFMNTGFAVYTREILKRLQADDRFECAELGSYADQNQGDAHNLPWKFYAGKPLATDQRAMQEYQQNKLHQFGAGMFEGAVTDFQPDVVLIHRDHWMDEWIVNHPLASKFHTIWMACVDSYPQQWQWLNDYSKADTVLAYADFGKTVLEEQSRTELARRHGIEPINVQQVCRAGVPLDEFFPMDKDALKQKYGIDPRVKIVGSVMRNQPRKLFPTLIEGFKNYLVETGDSNAMLLLHTGVPDVGFDIPEYIHRFGVNHKVLFSTICHKCDHNSVQLWGFEQRPCPSCGTTGSVKTCNTAKGLENERFNEIYNLMDLYVQASIAGADEMPATEAKAAGVPVACTEYAAMYEKAHAPGGFPLKVSTFFHEAETKQTRAYVDHRSITKVMKDLLGSENRRVAAGQMARKHVERYYDWDITADKWKSAILNAELKNASWEKEEVLQSTSADRDKSRWTLMVEEGEVFEMGVADLEKEVFTQSGDSGQFYIPVLTELENGTIDTHSVILEPRLMKGDPQGNEGLILTSSQQIAHILHTQAQLLKADLSNPNTLGQLRNLLGEVGEAIRQHIAAGQPYIIRRNNG